MKADNCNLEFNLVRPRDLVLILSGDWIKSARIPDRQLIGQALESNSWVERVSFISGDLHRWDSLFLIYLLKVNQTCLAKGVECDLSGLPSGVVKLVRQVSAMPPAKPPLKAVATPTFMVRIGMGLLSIQVSAQKQLYFLGEVCLSFARFFTGKAQFRKTDIGLFVEQCGPKALPIVTLISILVGLILAFVGSVQLSSLGAQIYIANLVGLGMSREMGAMMTGVIMAGRTGAAFAAQLGAMKANDEIDAFKTMGISPVDFLVLPRILALILMMPLLCLYADFMGIVGGMLVGVTMLDISFIEYFAQTKAALAMRDFNVGLLKCAVFGILVAIAGCMRGMEAGRNSSSVGEAATNAVVTSIVWIIVSDAILTIIYNAFGV